jgi:hypothetical protein
LRSRRKVVEHKYNPKLTKPTDKELAISLHIKEWLRPLVPINKILREVVFEPELIETRKA